MRNGLSSCCEVFYRGKKGAESGRRQKKKPVREGVVRTEQGVAFMGVSNRREQAGKESKFQVLGVNRHREERPGREP